MTDINVTLICENAHKAEAEALAEQYPGGAGTFSISLATAPDITDLALATHWAGSGYMPEEMVAAFQVSVAPMYKVFPLENTDFNAQIAACTPTLYRLFPAEEV